MAGAARGHQAHHDVPHQEHAPRDRDIQVPRSFSRLLSLSLPPLIRSSCACARFYVLPVCVVGRAVPCRYMWRAVSCHRILTWWKSTEPFSREARIRASSSNCAPRYGDPLPPRGVGTRNGGRRVGGCDVSAPCELLSSSPSASHGACHQGSLCSFLRTNNLGLKDKVKLATDVAGTRHCRCRYTTTTHDTRPARLP